MPHDKGSRERIAGEFVSKRKMIGTECFIMSRSSKVTAGLTNRKACKLDIRSRQRIGNSAYGSCIRIRPWVSGSSSKVSSKLQTLPKFQNRKPYTVLAATNVKTISPPLGRCRRRRRPSAAAASPVSYDDDKLQMGRCYQLGGALWYNIKILGHSIQNSIRCHLARQNF